MERIQSRQKSQKYKGNKQKVIKQRSDREIRTRRVVKRVLLALFVVVLVIGLLWFLQIRQIERQARPVLNSLERRPSLGTIEITGGEQLIAETDEAALYLNAETANIRLHDKINDISWPLQAVTDDANASEKALLLVEFLGENGELTEWDTYSYSVASGTYELNRIENGLSITMHISQGASTRFDDYMPRRISAERYESFFVEQLEVAKDNDEIEASEYAIFQLALKTAYKFDNAQNDYFLSYIGNPPSSTVRRLIQISRAVNYTYDDLVLDNTEHGIVMEERENPQFSIPLEISLDEGDLVVRIPAAQIDNKNPYYQIHNISILPNFIMADGSDYEDGWMLVSDGSGALIRFNEANPSYPAYTRQLRDSDYYDTYYFKDNYSEAVSMPIFGMLYGSDSDRERSVLAIMEDGTSLGGIRAEQANLSGDAAGMYFNRIYPMADITQFARINVYGPYALQDTRYLVSTGMQEANFQIRYKVFGADSQYFDLAKAYQAYLLDTGGLNAEANAYANTAAHLKVLGTVDVDKRFVGIPYSSQMSMTTYDELKEILQSLNQENLLLTYQGAFKGGYNQDVLRQAMLESENGSSAEWAQLNDLATSLNSHISLEASFSRAADNNSGFVPRLHGITAYDNNTAYIYQYDASTGRFNPDSFNYVRISPWYLGSIVDGFLADEAPSGLLSIPDLGQDFFADYDETKMLSAYESEQIVRESLAKLGDEYDLIMADSFMGLSGEASFISSVSRLSSQYASFYTSVPFRQIVLNGAVPYSTDTINMSAQPMEYYVLQAAETAAVPQFTITAKSSELMKELMYDGFFSTQYSQYESEIKAVIAEVQEIRERIGSTQLSGHELLGKQFFLSTYENNSRVLVNYGSQTADFEGTVVEPMSYVILEEGEITS